MSHPLRYTFILGLVGLATGLAAIGGWRYARASAPVSGPIIVVSVDALRPDRLSPYGFRAVTTPAIEALAADGVVFERAYSHAPQTLPAHAAMLTGRLPFENGVRDEGGFVLADRERSVAEMLRDRGYATGAIVSSYSLRRDTGLAQGFTYFNDEMSTALDKPGAGLWRGGTESERLAEEWLERAGPSRTFLFLHLFEPHTARVPFERSSDGSPYDTEVAKADDVIGRLVRYLKSHQLYDRSTIILVSDHGEGFGEHGEQEHGWLVYDEALKVPLIIKQAAGEGAGRRVKQAVQHVDLVPTLLDFAKAPDPGGLRGRSLKPLLDGNTIPRRIIYSESLYGHFQFGRAALTTLTDGRFRYIKGAKEELYDLELDPAQENNLAASDPSVEKWRQELARYRLQPPPPPSQILDKVAARLEALGFVRGLGPSSQVGMADDAMFSSILETQRTAAELAAAGRWPEAFTTLQTSARRNPAVLELWLQLAKMSSRHGRDEQALAAYRRIIAHDPANEAARLAVAESLLRLRRLDEARQQAAIVGDASEQPAAQAAAHSLLAEIALTRGDARTAREQAALAAKADPQQNVVDYVEARLLAGSGEFEAALPLFEKSVTPPPASKLEPVFGRQYHFAAALSELNRDDEAERAFLAELDAFPQNINARAALSVLYHRLGRFEEAASTLTAMTALTPSAEAFRISARLWEEFGEREKAVEARAEARRLSTQSPLPAQTAQR
jgi:arylsulfatase A-like enzyme/cytochrome c-type biogenesis protein CcmH/NrfG